MARYFFDIYDGAETRDHDGTELPTLDAARAHALHVAAAYAGKPAVEGRDGGAAIIEVRDMHGQRTLTARFAFDIQLR